MISLLVITKLPDELPDFNYVARYWEDGEQTRKAILIHDDPQLESLRGVLREEGWVLHSHAPNLTDPWVETWMYV